jgi:hypothetical protein
MGDIWLDEIAPPDDGAEIHGGPQDLFARIRAGAVTESEQDRHARRLEQAAEIERQDRIEQRENAAVLAARRGEGFSSFGDVAVRAQGIFQAQDRRDRQTDRQIAAMGETLRVERGRLAKLERDLAERSAELTRQLTATNAAHRSRHFAQEELELLRRRGTYAPPYFRRY